MCRILLLWVLGFLLVPVNILAQGGEKQKEEVPPISILRASESYLYLDTMKEKSVFLQPLKLIPIDRERNVFLTLGGEYRARFEHFTNKDYTVEDLSYYSQRVDFHASLMLGKKLRLFGEVYSGYVTNPDRIFLESDEIDLHQGFLEWKPVDSSKLKTTVRLGRQEVGYGASRLVGIREGPNMRRSFDMARVIISKKNSSLDLFFGKEVDIFNFGFDNRSNIFDSDAINPSFWGVYYRRPILKDIGKLDIYYFGFHSNVSRFNDVIGEELRHSIGIRSFSVKGRWKYNTEVIVQWGDLGGSDIFAYNIEADYAYALLERGWKPTLGLKADISSGDDQAGDGKIGTFNPMFVNPAIYSLAAVNTPANIMSIHPNFTLYPTDRLSIYVDYAFFYRTKQNDGLYTPPRFLIREAGGIDTRHIGDVFGLQVKYQLNRNISFDLRSSYFIAGQFIEASGESENTFYVSPTVSLKF